MAKFSIFTCGYKTTNGQATRLYQSLLNQTETDWDWWILDDSPNKQDTHVFTQFKDDRVHIFYNRNHHGVIGYNKHMIAMCCDGDYLIEIDHDDEIAPDCLELIGKAFEQYPDAVFAYSDCAEMIGEHMVVHYDGDFSFGQGYYETREIFDGWIYPIAITTPSINCKSIRGIYAQPNHVRCWRKDFYHQIGGHDITLPVCDDMDLMVRTFLNGKMIHINKVLYIQHEEGGNREDGTGNNTQSKRYQQIQELNWLLYDKYDRQIHDRIIELCGDDQIWNGEYSELMKDIPREELIDLGYQYNPNIDE